MGSRGFFFIILFLEEVCGQFGSVEDLCLFLCTVCAERHVSMNLQEHMKGYNSIYQKQKKGEGGGVESYETALIILYEYIFFF